MFYRCRITAIIWQFFALWQSQLIEPVPSMQSLAFRAVPFLTNHHHLSWIKAVNADKERPEWQTCKALIQIDTATGEEVRREQEHSLTCGALAAACLRAVGQWFVAQAIIVYTTPLVVTQPLVVSAVDLGRQYQRPYRASKVSQSSKNKGTRIHNTVGNKSLQIGVDLTANTPIHDNPLAI